MIFSPTNSIATSVLLNKKCVTHFIAIGNVKIVIILLSIVSNTDNSIFPFASRVNAFEELPPGDNAINISPTKYIGLKFINNPIEIATMGKKISCPIKPIITGVGFLIISFNDACFNSVPIRNINIANIGITIQIDNILYCYFCLKKLIPYLFTASISKSSLFSGCANCINNFAR